MMSLPSQTDSTWPDLARPLAPEPGPWPVDEQDGESSTTRPVPLPPTDVEVELAPEPAAPRPPRLRAWTLPNGRFLLVFDRLGEVSDDSEYQELAERAGAVAMLTFREEVDLEDTLADVPAAVAAEDERLITRLRQMQSDELAELRTRVDQARHDVVKLNAMHEAARRDLDEALDRMHKAREMARAHGYAQIVELLTLPEDVAQ